jgi:hypothetical protein
MLSRKGPDQMPLCFSSQLSISNLQNSDQLEVEDK